MKIEELEETIGYHFRDAGLLTHALTHSSYINEHALIKSDCNERLEFLGDAVLEMISSEFLYGHFPERPEGELSKIRASLVCEPALAEAAREIRLGEYLILGKGMELGGGRKMDSVTSDAFEALIAALYLDGGLEQAKKLIYAHVLNNAEEKMEAFDAKTTLQEFAQARGMKASYELIEEKGPEHDRSFTVLALIGEARGAAGTGHSKKQAEQNAAFETIKRLRNGDLCI